jgi:hypothetical protein
MDERIRTLERQLIEDPDIPTGGALIRARLGAGEITTASIRGAAALGCAPAIAYLDKQPDMNSHSKKFYILLGYSAIHCEEIEDFMDKVLLPANSERFFVDSNKILEAFLAGEKEVDLSPHFIEPLSVKDAGRYYAGHYGGWHYGSTQPNTAHFHEHYELPVARFMMGTLQSAISAYSYLLNALHTKTWARVQQCLECVVYTRHWITDGTPFPPTWEFEPGASGTRDEQRQLLLDDQLNTLIQDISPHAIEQLVGPYLNF